MFMTSPRLFIEPSALVIDKPYCSIKTAASSVGLINLVREPLRAVPPCEPLIPALAIRPRAIAVSSAEYPRAPATGAAYLKDSPSMLTLVFAFEEALARTSAKCPLSEALKPKAVKASVTISDVVARSRPSAAAKLMIPSIPLSMSSVFQPAIAIYVNASADSVALNFVLAPISWAFLFRASRSPPVAPEIADTLDIADSKSDVTFTAAVPRPRTGVVTVLVRVEPAEVMLLPAL